MKIEHTCRFCGQLMELEIPSDNPDHPMFPVHDALVNIAKVVSCERCCKYEIEKFRVLKETSNLSRSWEFLEKHGNPKDVEALKLKISKLCHRWIQAIDGFWGTNLIQQSTATGLMNEIENHKLKGALVMRLFEKQVIAEIRAKNP